MIERFKKIIRLAHQSIEELKAIIEYSEGILEASYSDNNDQDEIEIYIRNLLDEWDDHILAELLPKLGDEIDGLRDMESGGDSE